MTRQEFEKLPKNTELCVDCNNDTMFAYEGHIVDPNEEGSDEWYKYDDTTIAFTGNSKCRPHFKEADFFFDEVEIIK